MKGKEMGLNLGYLLKSSLLYIFYFRLLTMPVLGKIDSLTSFAQALYNISQRCQRLRLPRHIIYRVAKIWVHDIKLEFLGTDCSFSVPKHSFLHQSVLASINSKYETRFFIFSTWWVHVKYTLSTKTVLGLEFKSPPRNVNFFCTLPFQILQAKLNVEV